MHRRQSTERAERGATRGTSLRDADAVHFETPEGLVLNRPSRALAGEEPWPDNNLVCTVSV